MTQQAPAIRLKPHPDSEHHMIDGRGMAYQKFSLHHTVECDACRREVFEGYTMLAHERRYMCLDHFELRRQDGQRH